MTKSSDDDHLLMLLPLLHLLVVPVVIRLVQHYRVKVGSLRRVSLFQDARLTESVVSTVASTSANNEPSLAAATNQCIKHVGSEENLVVAVASTSEFIKHVNSSLTNRLETKADEDSSFVICDIIAPIVVEFLGVLSLVRFGATSKSHRVVVLNEVMRRRKVVALIEEDVSNLIGSRDEMMKSKLIRFNIPRNDVRKAKALVYTAMRLIDDEIGIVENHPEMKRYCCGSWEEDYVWKDTDVFFLERRKFFPRIRSDDVIGPMYVFPDCFYFPTQGEISVVSQDDYRKAGGLGRWLLDAIEDGIQANQDGDTSWVYDLVEVSAFRLANEGIIDAFRVAARSISHIVPSGAPNPFWNVLELADEFSSNGVGQKKQ